MQAFHKKFLGLDDPGGGNKDHRETAGPDEDFLRKLKGNAIRYIPRKTEAVLAKPDLALGIGMDCRTFQVDVDGSGVHVVRRNGTTVPSPRARSGCW